MDYFFKDNLAITRFTTFELTKFCIELRRNISGPNKYFDLGKINNIQLKLDQPYT